MLYLLHLETYNFLCREHRVSGRVVSEGYILKNTESVVSGLIHTKLLLENIEFKSKLYLNDTCKKYCLNTPR